MNEQSKHNDSLPQHEAGQDVLVLIKRMQQQLESLEKKVDILINQSQPKPYGEKRFSRPFRSFGQSHRRPDRERGSSFEERGYRPRRDFEKRGSEESREFSPAPARPTEGHFKKHFGRKERGGQENKPFFYKRRERR